MRKVWIIVALRLKEFFTSPGFLVLMFLMPILFGGIFGGISMNSQKTKPVVNIVLDDSKLSKDIANLLKKDPHFTWKEVSEKQAKKNISGEDAVAAVMIPTDIGQRIRAKDPVFDVMVQRKTEDYITLSTQLEGTASLVLQAYQATDRLDADAFPQVLEAIAMNNGITVQKQSIEKESNDLVEVNLMFVGFALLFMMFGLSGAASMILDERKGGTWGRLMISPITKLQISLGYLLAYFIMGWIQLAVLMTAMKLIFSVKWGNPLYLIPFASLVILFVVSFGLLIASIVKTKQQAAALSAVLIVSTCMLGGVYWPIEVVPEIMQKIALAIPQTWAMSGFREIISGSLHSGTLLKDSVVLIGFTAGFFIIGVRSMKFE